ncbi:MAG: ABC transporter ATP-binding protein [Caldilineaceae bacterium]|nr:ABC transporter ATP-binding protein [Caldilineaceae bacterium]
MFLRLEHLSKAFAGRDGSGEVLAVNDVNLNIERGEFLTLLGPSGCGKTTTLRLIAGFEFPTDGKIILDDQTINELPPNRRDMAMVFQSYALFPHLSVYDNIAYGLKIKKLSRQEIRRQVDDVMSLAELEGLGNRAPNQLSGGQQQRVALARALVMQPKVLLFDEPLSNLDAKLRVQMRSEIRRIQQESGITSVYVTHDQDEAMALSDRIVVMHQGRIQQAGSAINIYRRPVNRFVADFIGRANFLPVTVNGRTGQDWDVAFYDTPISIPAAADENLSPGEEGVLMVRPESIHLTPPGGNALGDFVGKVIRRTYLGEQVEYVVLIHGEEIIVVHHDPSEEELLPEGADAALAFIRDNLYLLPQNKGES